MDFKVKHADGTEVRLISSANKSVVTSAVQKRKLCGEDTVTINLTSAEYIEFRIGDTLDVFGTTYTINQLPTVKKINERNYEYTLVFEGLQYALIDHVFLMPDNTQGNNLMLDLAGMMTELVANINRDNSGKTWEFECPADTEYKNLSLTEKNCLQVLQQLCQEWDTEFTIVESSDKITIKVGQAGSIFPITFTYGQNGGIYELNREKGATDIVTRLFCYGGTQNLTWYRHNRLCLPGDNPGDPGKTKNESYIEDSTAMATYGLKEAVKNFDDIYPDRRGKVSSVSGCAYNEFIDTSMADTAHGGFDLNAKWTANDYEDWLECRGLTDSEQNQQIYANDVVGSTRYLIPQTSAKIHFNTGALAGYEVEIHSYNHSTQKFVLQPLVDENGYDFPSKTNTTFRIAANDEYIIVDINLPESYKKEAEGKLKDAAEDYFATVCNPQPKYTLELEPLALEKIINGLHSTGEREIFATGDTVKITDTENGIIEANIRIDSFERDLIDPYKYKLSLTDEITYTAQVRTLIEVNQIKRVVQESKIYDVNRIRRGWRDVEEMYNMVFDTDGYFQDKIAPMSIDTMMLKVGARSQQLVLQNVSFEANFDNNANKFNVVSNNGVLVHYGLADDGEELTWNIASSAGPIVLTNNGAYYIYARCKRDDYTSGAILASQSQIKFDQETGWWNFLIGTLGSVDTITYGDQTSTTIRNFAPTYGYSAINGRTIRTGVIQSADGLTSFDLDQGKIKGNIVFEGSGGSEIGIDQYINDTVDDAVSEIEIGGRNLLIYKDAKISGGNLTTTKGTDGWFHIEGTISGTSAGLPRPLWGEYTEANTIAANGYYTLSIECKGTMPIDDDFKVQVYSYTTGGTTNGSSAYLNTPNGKITVNLTDRWLFRVVMYKTANAAGTVVNGDIRFKLERGDVATDWTPAPEDTEAEITQVSDETLRLNLTGSVSSRNTSGSTRTYIISCSQWKSGFYAVGTRIKVSVGTYSNSGYKAALRIDSVDKAVKWMGSTNNYPEWATNDSVTFEYDGTYWFITDEAERITNAVYKAAQAGVTSINGGLILTKVVQVGEGANQAGMSGLANSTVAIWAGGTIGNAQNQNTPVVIFKDGNAKFGLLNISKSGKLYFQNSGVERFVIQNDAVNFSDSNKVYNPSNINNTGATDNILTPNISGSAVAITGTASNPDVFSVVAIQALNNATAFTYYPNMLVHITFSASLYCNSVPSQGEVTCGFALEIYDGTDWNYLDDSEVEERFDDEGSYQVQDIGFSYEYNAASIPSTTGYKSAIGLRVVAWKSGGGTASFKYTELTWSYYKDISKTKTIIGNNGFGVMRNSTNMFKTVIDANEEYLTTTIKGKVDMPGVLWAGKVAKAGGVSGNPHYQNSAKYSTAINIQYAATGKYTITHRLGTANFSVSVTPYDSGATYYISSKSSTTVVIQFNKQTDFDLVLFGTN